MKFTLNVEADNLNELLELLGKGSFQIPEQPLACEQLDQRFKLSPRKHKQWTDFELNFLTQNYLSKNTRWLAGKLQRPMQGVSQKLHEMYKKGLKHKFKKVKTL